MHSYTLIKEACVETLEQALIAQRNGAHQVELCGRLDLDGLTPEYNLIQEVQQSLSIPVKVMIRPRSGNFIYTPKEIVQIKKDIEFCQSAKVDGIVLGTLNNNQLIDVTLFKSLIRSCKNMSVTFHKAIDQTNNLLKAIDDLKSLDRSLFVLTSGGEINATAGINVINQMIEISGEKINIIAAGSITDKNFEQITQSINTRYFHGKRIVGQLN